MTNDKKKEALKSLFFLLLQELFWDDKANCLRYYRYGNRCATLQLAICLEWDDRRGGNFDILALSVLYVANRVDFTVE